MGGCGHGVFFLDLDPRKHFKGSIPLDSPICFLSWLFAYSVIVMGLREKKGVSWMEESLKGNLPLLTREMCQQKEEKMREKILLVLCFSLFLTGCAGVEPEKRTYPLVMAADYKNGVYTVSYGMPNLPASTGQEKDQENGDNPALLTFEGETLEEIQEIYESSQEKYLDMGHLKVLLLGEELVESDAWQTVLRKLRQDPSVGEDIYVFQTRDIQKVMELNGRLSSSLGEYILGIYENRPSTERKKGISLRKVYSYLLEKGELIRLPRLKTENGSIRILFEMDETASAV